MRGTAAFEAPAARTDARDSPRGRLAAAIRSADLMLCQAIRSSAPLLRGELAEIHGGLLADPRVRGFYEPAGVL
jgi:hypothetical protein